ncbi:MAG: hypothetical protein AB7S92_19545 [Parvibaculaceae bacterium]
MPSAYFESDGLKHLEMIFDRAMALVEKHHPAPKELRDTIAARILHLAAKGDHDDDMMLKFALEGIVPAAGDHPPAMPAIASVEADQG